MAERMIDVDGVELCTEAFGDPGDPPILLVHGLGASMLWWDEAVCTRLADHGRFVVRYDHRDTGRSTAWPPGRPGYDGSALDADALGVLDSLGLADAHLVGISAGGGVGQALALAHPDRVRSLVLVSTSPGTTADRDLPGPTAAVGAFLATAEVDWDDPDSVVDHLVGWSRALAGDRRPFDEQAWRDLIERDVARTRSVASLQNHDLLSHDGGPDAPLSSITAPTLVVHGDADPLFPLAHGEALAAEIPGAALLTLAGAGHGLDRPDHDDVVEAIVDHTSRADRAAGR